MENLMAATQTDRVTVYTTPACPWCTRAKEFLRQRNVPYQELDVSRDPQAAQEMQRRSGQMGVPVITAGSDVIVGFDQRRLEQVAQRYAGPPSVGLRVKDDPVQGVVVGGARPGSPAERAGVLAGDVVESLGGRPVQSVSELAQVVSTLPAGRVAELKVKRRGISTRLPLSL